jgi:two-component system sensor histidine kinase RegB
MGLGIFIARTLLSHHGANLEFSNDPAGGAVVEIRWPRDRLEVVEARGSTTESIAGRRAAGPVHG